MPRSALLVFVGGLLLASRSDSATIFINDALADPLIRVTLNDFEGAFLINGVLRQEGLGAPAIVDLDETLLGGTFSFAGGWHDNGNAVSSHRKVYFTAGATNKISAILEYIVTHDPTSSFAGIDGIYTTDLSGELGFLPLTFLSDDVVWNEDDGAYDFSQPLLDASALSDSVPEPASWLLFGGGLAAAALRFHGSARRRL